MDSTLVYDFNGYLVLDGLLYAVFVNIFPKCHLRFFDGRSCIGNPYSVWQGSFQVSAKQFILRPVRFVDHNKNVRRCI